MAHGPIANALTIDVEDWYQSASGRNPLWESAERRLHIGMDFILDTLATAGTKATFFVLAQCVRDHPALIQRIAAEGHELGTHLDSHGMVYNMSPQQFAQEVRESVDLLQQATGQPVRGHRAPFFSITQRSYEHLAVLAEAGLAYDSSIYPGANYRYGIDGSPAFPYRLVEFGLAEFPVSVRPALGQQLGLGGAYFRIMPYAWTAAGIRAINAAGHPAGVYLHPWEFDPRHPQMPLGRVHKITHYFNLHATRPRFAALLRDFRFAPMGTILESLDLPVLSALPAQSAAAA